MFYHFELSVRVEQKYTFEYVETKPDSRRKYFADFYVGECYH